MLFDSFDDLNWLAVLVATVVWFGFSALWYSFPPLSKAWRRAAEVDPSAGGMPLATILVPTFIGYFVTTVVIALLARAIGAESVGDGLVLGIALGVAFGLVSALVVQLYEGKGGAYWLINGVNAIVALSLVSAIVSVWD